MFRYFAIAVLIFFFQSLQAQTLMTLDTGFEFTIKKAQSNAFEITWYFNKNASTSLLIAYDTNFDGQFKGKEKVDLIEMLKQFEHQDYLLSLKQESLPIKPESITIIAVNVEKTLVSATFGVVLNPPVDLQKTGLSLAFVPSKRVEINQDTVTFKLNGMLARNCAVKVLENKPLDSHNWHHISCTK